MCICQCQNIVRQYRNSEYLDTCLVAKEIDMLPVATIQSNLVPILGHASTSTQAHNVQIREHPAVQSRQR